MVASYKELLAQKLKLEAEIATAREAEATIALEGIRKVVEDFGFTLDDVFGTRRKPKADGVAPRFRDPVTGATWSGRGRQPRWIKGKDVEEFRIKE